MPKGVYIKTKEHRIKLSKANKGKHQSDITKKILSLVTSGENNPFFGKHHTKESKEKMRKYHIGKTLSEKHKKNISKSQKNYINKMTKEERKKRSKNWNVAGRLAALKANPSSIEKSVCKILDLLNIKYKTQVKINNWIVDIYIPIKNLIIECNGNYWHNYKIFPNKRIRDNKLEKYAKKNRYKLIWLWENEINKNVDQLVKNIFQRSK